jgi:PEP-CTERM motif
VTQPGKPRLLVLACALIALPVAIVQADGIDTNDPSLPPMDPAKYLSPDDVHADYSGPGLRALLRRPEHLAIICHDPAGAGGGPNRTTNGTDEFEEFCSELRGGTSDIDVGNDGSFEATGLPASAIDLGRNTRVVVFGKTGNTTGTFDTEMLSMLLQGTTPLGPYMIRESPTRASTGRTTITDIGGGMYHIDSFFDVFTELSVDGGASWIPDANGPTRVNLVPEPSSFALIAMGLAGAVGLWWRRKRVT